MRARWQAEADRSHLEMQFRRTGTTSLGAARGLGAQGLPREDAEVAEAVKAIFEQDGIDIVLDADVHDVEGRSGDRIRLRLRAAGGERVLEGSSRPGVHRTRPGSGLSSRAWSSTPADT